ncbi:hypothetical protein VNO78_02635 [Psophocarpus tetragonolobus]|uniref:TF-B3 domain-containing protein n=1 Tax=Psophocarpus tetragonolobus TaxID=3891 RepID=A0AAN9T067_PSOTE
MFTKRCGDDLPNPVSLIPSDCKQGEVLWKRGENGEVWFKKGWKKFVENYSLSRYDFVLFKYNGTSKIDVLILDNSAMEKNYPSFSSDYKSDTLDENDDKDVEMVQERRRKQKAKQNFLVDSSQPKKKTRFDKCKKGFQIITSPSS